MTQSKSPRNKYIAAALAFFLGGIGVHHFYLGNKKAGIIYLVLFWTAVPSLISKVEALIYLLTSDEDFDTKYNKRFQEWEFARDRDIRRQERNFRRQERRSTRTSTRANREQAPRSFRADDHKKDRKRRRREPRKSTRRSRSSQTVQPGAVFKKAGIKKFKEYDIDGAIEQFEMALKQAPQDAAIHFNLACSYSIMENKEESFYHLSKAVEHGFKDVERFKTHEALAYLRIQDNWEDFVAQGYTLSGPKQDETKETPVPEEINDQLLDQLNKLKELRDRGLLTQEEFTEQRERLGNV